MSQVVPHKMRYILLVWLLKSILPLAVWKSQLMKFVLSYRIFIYESDSFSIYIFLFCDHFRWQRKRKKEQTSKKKIVYYGDKVPKAFKAVNLYRKKMKMTGRKCVETFVCTHVNLNATWDFVFIFFELF